MFVGDACHATRNSTEPERKKAQTERSVREALNAGQYKIKVDYMQPMRGRSRALTSDYSIEIRNDSVFSYLPYFGVAYNVPYGGGKGLIFNAPLTEYKKESLKKERPGSTSRPAMKRISMSTA